MRDRSEGKSARDFAQTFLIGAVVLLLSGSFLRLGFWQLDRAQELKQLQNVKPASTVVDLLEIAQPGTNLSGSSVNKKVRFSGKYIAQYLAPDQAGGKETWLVGLMEIPDIGAILVARSVLISQENSLNQIPSGGIEVIGRLMPRQFDNRAPSATGTLTRIDSSLIVEATDLALFDGFVIAESETAAAGESVGENLQRIEASPAKPTVPGYYWQHIAYVAIWWLAAVVVLFLPIYQRFQTRERRERLTNE